jgi:hypothetical protein
MFSLLRRFGPQIMRAVAMEILLAIAVPRLGKVLGPYSGGCGVLLAGDSFLMGGSGCTYRVILGSCCLRQAGYPPMSLGSPSH